MEQKTCLLVYVGNGYSEGETSYYNSYIYSVDMRENKENHHKNIIKPLEDLGYKVDTTPYKITRTISSIGGKAAMSNPINVDNFKKVASKYAVDNSLKSRYKLQKAVLQYDLDGNFIKEWPGVRYVKTHTNICCSKCVRGLKKQQVVIFGSLSPNHPMKMLLLYLPFYPSLVDYLRLY